MLEQEWVRGCFLRRGEKRSILEEFQNLAIRRTVKEVITFWPIGGRTNQLQNQVIQTDRLRPHYYRMPQIAFRQPQHTQVSGMTHCFLLITSNLLVANLLECILLRMKTSQIACLQTPPVFSPVRVIFHPSRPPNCVTLKY